MTIFDDHIPVEVSGAANLPSPRVLAENLKKKLRKRTPQRLKDVLGFAGPEEPRTSAGAFLTVSAILSSAEKLWR